MKKLKTFIGYFTKTELTLWITSVIIITASFLIFDRESYLTLAASLVGITSLIFCAKGNPIGQALMIIFSIIYGIISYGFAYYGEMITYLGMSLPMAAFALVSWLKNPYQGKKSEVKVNTVKPSEYLFLILLTALVTLAFYFILRELGTENLTVSTLSVTTSFAAVYLTFRRSPYFALAYALNDVVLMILWVLACFEDIHYVSVVACFAAFLASDVYGFISWQRMKRRQCENE